MLTRRRTTLPVLITSPANKTSVGLEGTDMSMSCSNCYDSTEKICWRIADTMSVIAEAYDFAVGKESAREGIARCNICDRRNVWRRIALTRIIITKTKQALITKDGNRVCSTSSNGNNRTKIQWHVTLSSIIITKTGKIPICADDTSMIQTCRHGYDGTQSY